MRAARIFKFFAGEALRRHGQTLESTRPGIEVETYREAVGVFGLITPWNFPIAIPAWKVAPALAFGNTVVLKPAMLTPAIAHALAQILHRGRRAGGVFNLVIGDGGVGRAIVDHEGIDGISFTGSQGVGASVAEGAVKAPGAGAARNGRQEPAGRARRCRPRSRGRMRHRWRILRHRPALHRIDAHHRHEGIHDRFVEALAERARALKVGDALDPRTQIGPAVSEQQLEQNLQLCEDRARRRRHGTDRRRTAKPGDPRILHGADRHRRHRARPGASIARKCSGRSQARSR